MDVDSRRPSVAGRFYSADPARLERDVERMLALWPREARPARVVVAPHAGYVYSGSIAAAAYARTRIPDRIVILCPNHTGRGAGRSLWPGGEWLLPGGALPVDVELAELVRARAELEPDRAAHLGEHAIEVQLPFLRALRADARIVPICLGVLSAAECVELGDRLADAIGELGRDVLIVASTDMSHYVPASVAATLDRLALERILSLDPEGLHAVVTRHDISMCGFVPTTVALAAARALSASRADLVRYGNSGEVSGDLERVVGYASVCIQ